MANDLKMTNAKLIEILQQRDPNEDVECIVLTAADPERPHVVCFSVTEKCSWRAKQLMALFRL